jgi:hypothetical protein
MLDQRLTWRSRSGALAAATCGRIVLSEAETLASSTDSNPRMAGDRTLVSSGPLMASFKGRRPRAPRAVVGRRATQRRVSGAIVGVMTIFRQQSHSFRLADNPGAIGSASMCRSMRCHVLARQTVPSRRRGRLRRVSTRRIIR